MRDEIDARLWDEHGDQFVQDVAKLFAWAKRTYCKFAAIQFRAPWRPRNNTNC